MTTNRSQAISDVRSALRQAKKDLKLLDDHIEGLRFVFDLLHGELEMDAEFIPDPAFMKRRETVMKSTTAKAKAKGE